MTWFLTGFAGFPSIRTTFLIPLFFRSGSNYTFVQDLDVYFRIKEFYVFDVSDYKTFFPAPLPVPRHIGDDGILAVTVDGSDVLYGTPQKLTRQLRDAAVSSELAPFFALEIGTFLNDPEMIQQSVEVASQRSASELGFWLPTKPNKNTGFPGDSPQSSLDSGADLDINFGALHAKARISLGVAVPPGGGVAVPPGYATGANELRPDWIQDWCKAWDIAERPNEKNALVHDAEQKILGSEVLPQASLEVFYRLVRGEYRPDWLLKALIRCFDRRFFEQPRWAALWLASRRIFDDLGPEAGVEYLETALDRAKKMNKFDLRREKRIITRRWSKIWAHLWKEATLRDELIALCHTAVPIIGNDKSFTKNVLVTLSTDEIVYHFSDTYLIEFLRRLEPTNAWAQVFVALKTNKAKSLYEAELIQMAKTWLRKSSSLGKGWKRVWTLIAQDITSDERFDLARHWLQKVYPDVDEWPSVMAAVIDSKSATDLDIHNAKQWLSNRKWESGSGRKFYRTEELRSALKRAGYLERE